MKIFKIIVIISNILLFFSGCEDEENVYFNGNIVGFVNLMDKNGIEVDDNSSVKISIENHSYSAVTNEIGRFELKKIPAGTYNISYTKDGYGIYKTFSYPFIGGNLPTLLYEKNLYKLPSIEVKSLDVSNEENMIYISGEISETNGYGIQIFIKDSPNVSNLEYDFSSTKYTSTGYKTNVFSQTINLGDEPFSLGDKIYLAIYFFNPYEDSGYYDPEKGKTIFGSYTQVLNTISLVLE